MSKKSFGFKMRLGFNDAKSLISLLDLTSKKIRKSLESKDITPEYNFSGIEIIPDYDFSYTIIFYFDNKLSIDELLDEAIMRITNE